MPHRAASAVDAADAALGRDLAGRQRVGGPGAAGAQRAQPDRPHPDLAVEPGQEVVEPLQRDLDVLDDALAARDGEFALRGMVLLDEIRGRLAEVFSLKTYKIDHVVHGAIASAASSFGLGTSAIRRGPLIQPFPEL